MFGVFKPGDRYAIIGDSITEQTMYSRMAEAYLRLAAPDAFDLHIMQYGWSGETATGFLARMDADLGVFKPTVASICFGMNDGAYEPYRDELGACYRKSMKRVIQHCRAMGVREIVVMSPGIVDQLFVRSNITWEQYNENLHVMRDIAESVAKEEQVAFADVYTAMRTALEAGKQHYGPGFHLTFDGIHPKENGHLLMAWLLLKALGMKGDVGASELGEGNTVKVDTRHWPVCFSGDPAVPDYPENMLPLIPFQSELNRFILRGAVDGPAMVRWGEWEYAAKAGELRRGINLADAFPRNPFTESFQKFSQIVCEKQLMDLGLIKGVLHGCRQMEAFLPDNQKLHEAVKCVYDSINEAHLKSEQRVLDAMSTIQSEVSVHPSA